MVARTRSNLDPPGRRARRRPSLRPSAPWIAALTPGALPQRLDWLAQPLFDAARSRPELALQLLSLDWRRLHLAALLLAHKPDASTEAIAAAFERSAREVARAAVGSEVAGVVGLLDRLPHALLEPEAYRVAVRLLGDRAAAALLLHAESLDEADFALLDALPAALRTRPVVSALAGVGGGARAAARLDRWFALVRRRLQPGLRFDPAAAMAAARTEADLRATLLALPPRLTWAAPEPARTIGEARRVDDVPGVRRLGRALRNCLSHVDDDEAHRLIYAWGGPQPSAACELGLHGRFGWLLGERAGVANAPLEPEVEAAMVAAFDRAGVATRDLVDVYDSMLATLLERTRARGADGERLAEDEGKDDAAARPEGMLNEVQIMQSILDDYDARAAQRAA